MLYKTLILLYYYIIQRYIYVIQVQLLVCRALSHILILPWPNIPESEQQWALRSEHHAEFVQRLTKEFKSLKGMSHLAKDKSLQERGELSKDALSVFE